MPDREKIINAIEKAKKQSEEYAQDRIIVPFKEADMIIALLKAKPEIVRCKDCGDCREDGYCERWHISVKPDFFCADGDDGNLQEGT